MQPFGLARIATFSASFHGTRILINNRDQLPLVCAVLDNHPRTLTPTHTHTQEINAQINTLKHEKTQLLNDNMSLEAVVATERDKLEALEDKKRISDEENQRLQAKVCGRA